MAERLMKDLTPAELLALAYGLNVTPTAFEDFLRRASVSPTVPVWLFVDSLRATAPHLLKGK